MVNFNTITINKFEPIYIQICKHIKRQIFQNTAANGDALPSRRELAAELGINPNTIQKAYKQLESEELLYTESNTVSFLIVNEQTHAKISEEFRTEFIGSVIKEAKLCGFTFKQVVDMLSKQWEEDE